MEKSTQMCLAQEIWLRAWTAAASHIVGAATCTAVADKCLKEFALRWGLSEAEIGPRIDLHQSKDQS